jgi:hypothetical protein
MSTSSPEPLTVDSALSAVRAPLRNRLVKFYAQLKQAYVRGDYDACGTRAGKFCETMIRLVQDNLEKAHSPFGTQINLYTEARRLEALPQTTGPEPLRVFIPRALCFLYTLRNKRGFSHAGGDLDSERIDAITCVRVADWCLCELIRVLHSLSLEEAQALVDSLATKEVQDVWKVGSKRRVLRPNLDYKSQTLLLLYSDVEEAVLIEDLFEWVEYSNFQDYKRYVLAQLHKDRLIEWDRDVDSATLSPTGIKLVEEQILKIGAS